MRKSMHPLKKQIERSKRELNVTNKQIAKALFCDVRTVYRKLADPNKFTALDLELLSDLLHWRHQTLGKFLEV